MRLISSLIFLAMLLSLWAALRSYDSNYAKEKIIIPPIVVVKSALKAPPSRNLNNHKVNIHNTVKKRDFESFLKVTFPFVSKSYVQCKNDICFLYIYISDARIVSEYNLDSLLNYDLSEIFMKCGFSSAGKMEVVESIGNGVYISKPIKSITSPNLCL